jgi:hypothetical protein
MSDMLQATVGKRRNQLHPAIHWPKDQYCSLAMSGCRSAFRISIGIQVVSAVCAETLAVTVVQSVWR